MTEKVTTDRRSVLKTAGGIAAGSALTTFASGAAMGAHQDGGTPVRVNQVGYPTEGHKVALVTSANGTDVSGISEFEVVDTNSGETVHSGSLGSAMEDGTSGSNHTVRQADFSDLTTAGEYKVVAGGYESHPFTIGSSSEVYGEVLASVGRLYTIKRANADIQDPVTGLDIGPGHMQDENAVIQDPDGDWLNDLSPGEEIDVTGGWYDAGDYGKYVITHGITAAQLMLAYERNPDAFDVGDFAIPDSVDDPNVGEMPDVLAEAKYGLQFLSKMQRPDGGVFFKVAQSGPDQSFPEMTAAPGDITDTRYVLGLSSAGTANAVGAFAMAARVFEDHDPEFASQMLDQAKKGFQWLQDNPDVVWEKSQFQDAASGEYGRSSYDAPDRYWAAAELLRTTGDSQYDDYIQTADLSYTPAGGSSSLSLPAVTRSPVDWNDPVSLGHYAYAKSDGTDSDTAATALQKAVWVGQRYNPTLAQNNERTFDAYTTGLYAYYWGCLKSGVSRAVQCRWGADVSTVSYVSPDADIIQWSMGPVHNALGRSATGLSYVTGYGDDSVMNPHDRIMQSQNMETPIPGMLVGGPQNADLIDGPVSKHISSDTPPGLSFVDDHAAYNVTEWAINYTAPLFAALAEFSGIEATPPEGGETTPQPPEVGTPSNLMVVDTSATSFTVSWDGADNASEYELMVEDRSQTVPAGTTQVTVDGLSPDTTYEVNARAVGSDGETSDWITVSATTDMQDTEEGMDVEPVMGDAMPKDMDVDMMAEDINGDGELRFTDLVGYYQHMDDPVMTDHMAAYDYNDDGSLDFNDIVLLYEEMAEAR